MAAAVKNEPRTEQQELKLKSAEVVNDSLESTRRILNMVEESEKAGNRTLVALDGQGEKLDHIEEGMDRINANMHEAEKNISAMEKGCGICVLPWKKVNLKDYSVWKADDDVKVVRSQPQRKRNEMGQPAQSGYVARITNDAREDEMDENLGQVNSILGNLRNMAIDMGSELENQNKQIKRINAKGYSNNLRVDDATKRVINLLKS